MARHRKQTGIEEVEPTLDISSLIDVCFLLLIYFLVTSTITPRETDLGMALPAQTQSDKQPDIEPLFIKIDLAGIISIGTGNATQTLDSDPSVRVLSMLKGHLDIYANAARAANSTPLVQIYADGGTTQQRVIDVLNALAGAGISSVTFTDLVDPP